MTCVIDTRPIVLSIPPTENHDIVVSPSDFPTSTSPLAPSLQSGNAVRAPPSPMAAPVKAALSEDHDTAPAPSGSPVAPAPAIPAKLSASVSVSVMHPVPDFAPKLEVHPAGETPKTDEDTMIGATAAPPQKATLGEPTTIPIANDAKLPIGGSSHGSDEPDSEHASDSDDSTTSFVPHNQFKLNFARMFIARRPGGSDTASNNESHDSAVNSNGGGDFGKPRGQGDFGTGRASEGIDWST
ncbi:hypothetical protein BOTBODRAFT_34293 [Botryobasidium botryosum FD-172 SS1]|uniref:Uncharacterized protein n=1 Tax=Botryobasidium botryosum (strain FD-172 SS1) TaxID=930990 RepID=A0A067MCW8_BOTB1|nr:hypothetical protein BOTBODRAFT_34293 [Botryobasidium botryosum FD-172 SS1]